jgi:hypothetical protein
MKHPIIKELEVYYVKKILSEFLIIIVCYLKQKHLWNSLES